MNSSRVLVLILFSALTVGCGSSGPELSTVSGTVKLDGQPLKNAFITFTPASGRPSFGGTDENGYYELVYTESRKGAVPGEHTVKVSTHRRADPESGSKAEAERIPAKYNSRSELKKTVEPGSNTIDIDISSKDGKVIQPAN